MVFCSCSRDDGNEEPKCTESIGKLEAKVHKDATLQFYSTTFHDLDDNTIDINADEITPYCIWIGRLSFTLEKRTGIHELKIQVAGGSGIYGETVYRELDDDVQLGRFDLYEAEPHTVEITALNDGKVNGVLSATYVYSGSNDFHILPDTLRFKNILFEAEFFDPAEGN
ncbi:MAG: hypothetical protein CR994_09260 [Maribacter sp.]|nr:MAG: hypothetical protein CR994_09260 [Maribacter sp.]